MATTVLLTAKLFISHLIFINWICAVFVCFIMWRQMAVVWQLSLNHLSNVLEVRISEWAASLSVVIFRPLEPWFPDKQPAVLAPAEANTSIRIQMSTSIQVPVFSHDIYKDLAASLCLCVYIVTFDNRKLTMWILCSFSRHTLVRGHTEAHSSQCESMRRRSPVIRARRGIFVITPAQPAQPSPAQPSPAPGLWRPFSLTRRQDTRQRIFYKFCRASGPGDAEERRHVVETHFSLDTSSARRRLLCPRPSAHMAQMSSHTKGSNFLSTKWDLLQGCFQIRRGVK